MNIGLGVAMILLGMLMMVYPLLETFAPLPDVLSDFGLALRSAWPATRDDRQFDDLLDRIDEVAR